MSDLEEAQAQVAAWLQPLSDEAAPCGPDLEYDNDFLALTQAAKGKPESQFGPAEAPDWLTVRASAAELLERSRDLRIAIYWLRAGLHMHGYVALPSGLQLVIGMLEQLWDHLHPLPDPDDGDPYARVNALTVLRDNEGLIADLRTSYVFRDRAVGELNGRAIELAAGLMPPGSEEEVISEDTLRRMVEAAVERAPELKTAALEVVEQVKRLQALADDKLGSAAAPDLRPLLSFANAVAALMPADAAEEPADGAAPDADTEAGAGGVGRGRLSGSISSRQEALKAIDMVCEYLERTEPSNPAPLFLRRARQLVNHNFLQLMKELAPSVMPDVARIVGIDPDTVETPR